MTYSIIQVCLWGDQHQWRIWTGNNAIYVFYCCLFTEINLLLI